MPLFCEHTARITNWQSPTCDNKFIPTQKETKPTFTDSCPAATHINGKDPDCSLCSGAEPPCTTGTRAWLTVTLTLFKQQCQAEDWPGWSRLLDKAEAPVTHKEDLVPHQHELCSALKQLSIPCSNILHAHTRHCASPPIVASGLLTCTSNGHHAFPKLADCRLGNLLSF
jgi:hypothetical protein